MTPSVRRIRWCDICHRMIPVEVVMLLPKPPDFRREVAWSIALDREISAAFEREHVPNCKPRRNET